MKCQIARDAIAVVLAVVVFCPVANVPARTVPFVSGSEVKLAGVTVNGETTSLIVPLIRESYENPTCTG